MIIEQLMLIMIGGGILQTLKFLLGCSSNHIKNKNIATAMNDQLYIEALTNEVLYLRRLVDRQTEEKKQLIILIQRMYGQRERQ